MASTIEFTHFLRLPEVKRIFGYRSDASVYAAIKAGMCTSGILISQRSRGWPDTEIRCIAAARIQGHSDADICVLVDALNQKRKTAMADMGVSV